MFIELKRRYADVNWILVIYNLNLFNAYLGFIGTIFQIEIKEIHIYPKRR